jgi:hypothetical protein
MTSSANLLCSLTNTQISSISSTIFTSSISTLSNINLVCPNMANWYSLAKTNPNYGTTLYTSISSLSELGSVISGISTTDIQLVSADSMSSITTTALQYMPSSTVNSLSATQISGLSNDQITSLMNSPNYASFSTSITSTLLGGSGQSVTNSADKIFKSLFSSEAFLGFYSIILISLF